MEHQLKNLVLLVINTSVYYNVDFEALDMVLMDIHYILVLDFFDIVVNPNVIHKKKFHQFNELNKLVKPI